MKDGNNFLISYEYFHDKVRGLQENIDRQRNYSLRTIW